MIMYPPSPRFESCLDAGVSEREGETTSIMSPPMGTVRVSVTGGRWEIGISTENVLQSPLPDCWVLEYDFGANDCCLRKYSAMSAL